MQNHREENEMDVLLDEDEESDADDFIVDDDGRPITEKKKKVSAIPLIRFQNVFVCQTLKWREMSKLSIYVCQTKS